MLQSACQVVCDSVYVCPIGNESAPVQLALAQCRFLGLAISNAEVLIYIFFQIKYTDQFYQTANSTGKLSWFEITKMMITV